MRKNPKKKKLFLSTSKNENKFPNSRLQIKKKCKN